MSSSEFETFGPRGRDVVKYFKSHFKPLKLDNVREIDLKALTIQYRKWLKAGDAVGKCS